MKTALKMASLAALTAATLALPAAAQDMKAQAKCMPKARASKCAPKCRAKKCAPKCASKCGAKRGSRCGAKR